MKKIISVFLAVLLVVSCFAGCDMDSGGSGKKEKTLAKLDMYSYDGSALMADYEGTPDAADFELTGKLPKKEPVTGDFVGKITIKDAQGKEHVYEDLIYGWVDELLLLRNKGDEIKYMCVYDPEDPERSMFVDMEWKTEVEQVPLLVYVNENLTETEARSVGDKFQSIKGITSVTFISAQEAYEDFVAAYGNPDAFIGIDASYLRHRYEVMLEADADMEKVVEILEDIEGVSEVSTPGMIAWYRFFAATDDIKEFTDLVVAYSALSMPEHVEQPSVDVPVQDDRLPKAYGPIVSEYQRLVQHRLSGANADFAPSALLQTLIDNYGLQHHWDSMVEELGYYGSYGQTAANYGYILMDLNGDSVQELLWVSGDREQVYAIFTLQQDSPVLLDCYWSRSDCVILDDGTVYVGGSGGADSYYYSFMVLDSQYAVLTEKASFGCEGGTYYQINQGVWQKTNYELFCGMMDGYPFEFGRSWYTQELTLLQ